MLHALKTSENTVRRVIAASERKDSERKSFRLGFGRQQTKALDIAPQQKDISAEGGYFSVEQKMSDMQESLDSYYDESKLITEVEKEYWRIQEVFETWLIESIAALITISLNNIQ